MSIILDYSLGLLVTLTLVLSTIVVFQGTGIQAQGGHLPPEEVDVLREIAQQLGKRDWDFSLNPCDGNPNWATPKLPEMPLYNNTLDCSCSFPGNVCHVVSLHLKGQDLDGVLPPSLAKLPYITTFTLVRHYLSGTIPPEWASTKLEYLAVTVNQLSGRIPTYLGNITSLVYLSFESNMLSGTVPAELGKLKNLANLNLNANNLSGKLPMELLNLTNLKELRLSNNNFTGKIPSFENWSHLEKLEMEGTGLEGPIPDSISLLTNLTELRLSDLSGDGSKFPNLSSLTSIRMLTLRSCNITGTIPNYIANMSDLKHLDLSFNNLNGDVPEFNLRGLALEKMYLTGNSLNGSFPRWIRNKDVKLAIDLSYNNLSENTVPLVCTSGTLNIYRSYSTGNKLDLGNKCLSTRTCLQNIYSIYINCGGPRVTIGNKLYEADEDPGGPAKFDLLNEYWGFSSTGSVWEVNDNKYIATNVSILTMKDADLYKNARLSPLSLTYYGRCLENGNYTVTLHFAEIVFRDNRSYQSLGRRAFDVYVQGVNQLKNFDIENEAGGVDKPTIKIIKNIYVNNGTLEIRFQYAGKGTTVAPQKGVFGPLISAISMESEFKAPTKSKNYTYVIVTIGVVVGVLCFMLLLFGIAWKKGYILNQNSREEELRASDLMTGVFTYRQIRAATDNFADSNKLGEGGFGSVYKGTLLDGTLIAVKQLSSKSKQGNREFVNEIGMIAGIQHPNVVKLHGCCVERKQLLLVYECMENNSLAHALFENHKSMLEIDWPTRQSICVGIAKGLAFLHEESVLRMVHRDIKATNILLDADLTPKISDFGLAKLDEEENTHITTRVAGTIGYMAPEYALWGYLTYKADVYSFGVLAMEIVVGKSNMRFLPNEDCYCLLDWAVVLKEKGSLIELVDPRLGSEFNKKEAVRMIEIALLCTNESPALRPIMSEVVNMLEGHTEIEEPNINVIESEDKVKFQAFGGKFKEMKSHEFDETNISFNLASSSSNDLYPHMNALREIAKELGKTDWNFDLNPCDGDPSWNEDIQDPSSQFNNSVICDCAYPDGFCHVVQIFLKGQDLAGGLPPSLAKLPLIKQIDLSFNYLNGTIPPQWASITNLDFLSSSSNRLSGSIPSFLGNITSLGYVNLENNMLSGSIPAKLGKLATLSTLVLSSNNLTGRLPEELNSLTNLIELRLSSNNFSGKIPNLGNCTKLQKLEIQGSGLEGPIPENLSFLTNLTELRIFDLSGEGSSFPNLSRLTSINQLMLRTCNITGSIPDYISQMSSLNHLDLSFNNLNGGIPDLISGLTNLQKLYLTGNSLDGSFPTWITNRVSNLVADLSYNNFSKDTVPQACGESLNLFRSYSSGNNSDLGRCLRTRPCLKDYYFIHINCGGQRVTIGNKSYEADEDQGGPARFVPLSDHWGYSNTGSMWSADDSVANYTETNTSILTMNDYQLYTKARHSLLSLTYYGRCLANGNYTVTLNFAEIVFRDNQSYKSLGRRAFDVYVQGVNILKNFNIKVEAGGVDKEVIKTFKGIRVTNKTLEIRFQYTGKGTTAVPVRGIYGPLISAISMEAEFKPPTHGKNYTFVIIGAVAAFLCLILIIFSIAWKTGYIGEQDSREKDLRGLDLKTGVFTYRQIKAATDRFAESNKLGEGGFGSVYMGTLLDGTPIAVKKLSSKSKQGNREFVNEIGMIAGIQHPNVVRLYGCVVEGNHLLLVYEYMENNSLAHALFEDGNSKMEIDWHTRQRICVGIAKGLTFLHEESVLRMVHRDIKATNVLLDADLTPKISDFGLAKLNEEENTHITTRVAGTIGYMAPEYALWGHLTYKADVYRSLIDLVDPRLGSEFNKKEALGMIKIALLCTNKSPALRPTMSEVVNMLEGRKKIKEPNMNVVISEEELKLKEMREKIEEMKALESDQTEISIEQSSSSTLFSNSQHSEKD
ncbi:hypothetical protein LXL04_010645 [Taraxacum kok-saghyz]